MDDSEEIPVERCSVSVDLDADEHGRIIVEFGDAATLRFSMRASADLRAALEKAERVAADTATMKAAALPAEALS